MSIGLIAQPWWVNLIILIPPLAGFSWRRGGVPVTARQLFFSGLFAACFGFLEAVVVVYLRAAVGLLPGYQGTLSDVIRMSGQFYVQTQVISQFPKSLLTLEVLREAATILMLLSVALLTSANSRARARHFPLDLRHLGHRLLRVPLGHGAVAPFAQGSRCALPHSGALAIPGVVSHPGERSRHGCRPRFSCHATKELIIKEKPCSAKRIPGARRPGPLISFPFRELFRIKWISPLLAAASQGLPPRLGCAD